MPKYKWTLLFRAKGGHKYFRDELRNLVAIADMSGFYPEETEDGVLWLDQSRPLQAGGDECRYLSVPVVSKDGDQYWTGATWAEALWIMRTFNRPLTITGIATHVLRAVPVEHEAAVGETLRPVTDPCG